MEQSYKEKYEQALSKAKDMLNYKEVRREDMEYLFPELAENKDEKIRKALLEMVHDTTGDELWIDYNVHKEEALDWLERQGEHANFRNKIQVGDKVTRNENGVLVNLSQLKRVAKPSEEQGEQKPFDYENANIQQKDFAPKEDTPPRYSIGDVLCDKSCTTLSKEAQSNFEITDIRNGMYICDKCSFPISQQDEYELVAKRIEQKPTDKVEPKFHEGEWITDGYDVLQISNVDIENQYYNCVNGNDGDINLTDKAYHLWTIQDAKDGDVLYFSDETIVIFKDLYNATTFHSYCHIEDGEFGISCEELPDWWEGKGFHPATKEQRDLLFQKMKEAGYEWDANKKKLKEIEKPTEVRTTGYWHVEDVEQKPTDEEIKRLLQTEYEKGRADAITEMQKEWSEEDERMLHTIIADFKGFIRDNTSTLESHFNECIDWLKSLRPQNRWKPSDEQITWLYRAADDASKDSRMKQVLNNLLSDLKKLMEK